jgi:hypothetical protein
MIVNENIIQSKLEKLLPSYCEVQVWHPDQFITIDIICERCIHLRPDVMDFLSSLNIKAMHFGYDRVLHANHVTFKL